MAVSASPTRTFAYAYLVSNNGDGTYKIDQYAYTTYPINDIPDPDSSDDQTVLGDKPNDEFIVQSSVAPNPFTYAGRSIDGNGVFGTSFRTTYFFTDSTYRDQANVAFDNQPFVVCFRSNTRIATARGEVAVENLVVGDLAVTSSGTHRPIRWIGTQTIDCRDHPKPGAIRPVRIAKGALGENRPIRDLWVSPRHGLCLDLLGEVLVPADSLINGATITQECVESVTYWHVELDRHDLLMAEGIAAESYLDTGNRGFFSGAPVGPDDEIPGALLTRADCCRPFAEGDSSIVAFVRERLRARAMMLGWSMQPDPVAGLHILVGGQVIVPNVDGTIVSVRLPVGCGDIQLISQTTVPALVKGSNDGRRLGVNLKRLTIRDDSTAEREIALDDARLVVGFHKIEGSEGARHRWTQGAALLPASLWADCTGAPTLRLELGGERLLRWVGPSRSADGVTMEGLRHCA